jgi:hexokinase
MSCAWRSSSCRIGVILGTGSNACYIERASNVEMLDTPQKSDDEKVCINTEWGAFGDRGSLEFIRTPYDMELDLHSINPGNQLFEKMLSGMYLGELVRLVVHDLASKGLMFNGNLNNKFAERFAFATKFMSEIEGEDPSSIDVVREILMNDLAVAEPSDQDCVNMRYVSECISKRSAHLVSAALASLTLKMENPNISIAVDGSLYRFHPKFHDLMVEKMTELLPSNYKFKFILSEDGSGRGAAIVAAVATKQLQKD